MLQNTTPESTEEYKLRKTIVNKIIRREKRHAEKEMLESLEKDYYSPKVFFKKSKAIKKDFKNSRIIS